MDGKGVTFSFKLVPDGRDPLIIGQDNLCNSDLRLSKSVIDVHRGSRVHKFGSYQALDASGNPRVYLDTRNLGHLTTLLASSDPQSVEPKKLAIKLHHFSHMPMKEMEMLSKRAGLKLTDEHRAAMKSVVEQCEDCPRVGRPKENKKVSTSRPLSTFNQEIEVDFAYISLSPEVVPIVFHCVDGKHALSELKMVNSRSLDEVNSLFEMLWVHRHGAPTSVGGDPEFGKKSFTDMLHSHNIRWNPRPARRHQKSGTVERKNGVIQTIAQRLFVANPAMPLPLLLSRAAFSSNVVCGSKTHSAFAACHGYEPGFLGIPQQALPDAVRVAAEQAMAFRAISRALKSRLPKLLSRSDLEKGETVLGFVSAGSQGRSVWHTFTVVRLEDHAIICRRTTTKKGPLTRLAYEDTRKLPSNPIAREEIRAVFSSDPHEDSHADAASSLLATEGAVAGQQTDEQTHEDQELDGTQGVLGVEEKERHIQQILTQAFTLTEGKQVHKKNLPHIIPQGIVDEACRAEFSNWEPHIKIVQRSELTEPSNVLPTHTVFKVKHSNGKYSLKARTVIRGDLDKEKGELRTDSTTTDFNAIRLVLTIAALHGLDVASLDVTGAFFQADEAPRQLFCYPPPEAGMRGVVWQLDKLPYGTVDANRQWAKSCRGLMSDLGFTSVSVQPELTQKGNLGEPGYILAARAVDDLLLAGTAIDVQRVRDDFRRKYKLSSFDHLNEPGQSLRFFGCEVTREQGGYRLSAKFTPPEFGITRERKKGDPNLSEDERKMLRSYAGKLLWYGASVSLPAVYLGGHIQRCLPQGSPETSGLENMLEIERHAHYLSTLDHCVLFPFLTDANRNEEARLYVLADASLKPEDHQGVTGALATLVKGEHAYHLSWVSHKQRRVSHSSFAAEVLAVAEGDEMSHHLKLTFQELGISLIVILGTDSKTCFDCSSSDHLPRDLRTRATIKKIQNNWISGDIDALLWVPGTLNMADSGTKSNVEMWKDLKELQAKGKYANLPSKTTIRGRFWAEG